MLALHLTGARLERVAQPERRVARALRVVLVGDRCPEQRHDPVAGVLVDRALEAVHAVGQDLEEALQDAVPLLGIELLRQLHRALHVGEEHGHLLALALQGGLRLEDLVGQVLRGVGAGAPFRLSRLNRAPALVAELRARAQLGGAARAALRETHAAFFAELRTLSVLVAAAWTGHGSILLSESGYSDRQKHGR